MKTKDKNFLFYRAYIIYFSFVVLMGLVIYMTVSIQLEDHANILDSSDKKIPKREVSVDARHGDILDKDLNPLVTTVSYFDIYMDPTVVEQKLFDSKISELTQGLSELFKNKSAREYENKIRKTRSDGGRYLLIKRQVTNDQRKKLRQLPIFDQGQNRGGLIDNKESTVRKKPRGKLAQRTLGYYSGNGKYAVGIEGAFHDELAGKRGREYEQKFATGWKKTGQVIKESVSGSDVVSTIDSDIQEVVHSELEKQLIEMDASHGCVVVMEVNTGYIRAISNLKRNSDDTFSESYNYAIGRLSTPGSTFKLAALMAALEDNRLQLSQLVDASGKYMFKGSDKPLYDSNYGVGYGIISVQQAFEKSSNVLAPTINDVYKDDPYRFIERLEKFYVTKPLGIKLAGEPTPKVSRPGTKVWSGTSIPYMSIGYEIEQTPLQTLSLYNAVANNGKLLRPLFVQEILHNGKSVEKFSPVILEEQICSQATINKMKKCLVGVMKRGTGSDLKSVMFDIAGKTGTAKLIDVSGEFLGRDESDYQASFCGFFPADKPLYSCIVVIYKPKKYIYGAKVSGTVFAEVANKVYASNLQYHKAINETEKKSESLPKIKSGNKKDITKVLSTLGYKFHSSVKGDWVSEVTPSKKINLIDNKMNKDSMPDVTGMTAKDAVYLLESMGFITQISGYGKVVEQSVPAGSVVEKGRLIKLNLKN